LAEPARPGPLADRAALASGSRQYHGRFDAATEAALKLTPEKSRAIINMTRPKTKAWAARLSDLLFPADDKNWGVSPTPVPELTDKAKEAAAAAEAKHAKPRRWWTSTTATSRPAPRPCRPA
jgi:hypothetical protein